MRIAVSNIAWDVLEDNQVAELLKKYQVDAIDIAPGKYFPNPILAEEKDIYRVKKYWENHGIELTGMQSLLFGTTGLNVFGSENSQQEMLNHLGGVCRIAGLLGATRLVFGSPKNRDRLGLSDEQANDIAIKFFNKLGDIAHKFGVTISLEPNPVCYGANFMTTSFETLSMVKAINHPAIKMQLDTGAISINNENIDILLKDAAPFIGHIHISEPQLSVVGGTDIDHTIYAAAIHHSFTDPLISIEMVATQNEQHYISIERAIQFVINTYRSTR